MFFTINYGPDAPCIVYLPTKAHKNGVNVGKLSIHGAYGHIGGWSSILS
jgi:hypothetical protein